MGFWTDFAPDQPRNRHLPWHQQTELRRSSSQKRRNQRNRNRAAHLGDAIGRHALTRRAGLWRLRCEPHHLCTFGAHLVKVLLRNGGDLSSLRAGHGARKRSFLAHKAKQCCEEQSQGRPAFHFIHFAVTH